MDEIQLFAEKRPENEISGTLCFEYIGNNKNNSKNKSNRDSVKLNFDFKNEYENSDIDDYEDEDDKYKELNGLKKQLENEKLKIKELVRKIIKLENELKEEK